MMRLGRYAVIAGFLALFSAGAGSAADSGAALERLLRDYRNSEARLDSSSSMELSDQRYLERYEDDLLPPYIEARRKINEETRAKLAAIDRSALGRQNQLSYDIFAWSLSDDAERLKPSVADRFQLLPLNQFNGAQITFARDMKQRSDSPMTRVRDYDAAIRRMLGFTRWIDQAILNMREGVEKGVTQPRSVIDRMISQVESVSGGDPEASMFLIQLKTMPESISGAERARIVSSYRAAVLDELLPTYRRLGEFLKTEYLPNARKGAGLSDVPGGKEMYLHLVKSNTTTELTPDEILDIGLAELKRIESEMEKVKQATGFSGSLKSFREFLKTDPRFKFKDEADMRTEFTRVRDAVLEKLDKAFSTRPRAELTFRFHEPFVAPDRPAAEYAPGSGDGRRPGTVFLNSFDLPSRPTYTSEVLELHEGVPGHHLQTQYAAANTTLPRFRRFGHETAFVEGWALYAESLGEEFGLYSDPYQKFGALSFDAWRASRLVVDIGMHWLSWPRETAVEFLMAHTTLSRVEAEEEIDRYIAIPGQALGYKIGERSIRDLREQAKSALGETFDLKRFHDAILRDGAMPLSILNAKVERWIADQKKNGP
jgi:uncharacterized protein (DUF885 family)